MFTLADLVRLTGAKRRAVQLWAEAGAIKADPMTERVGAGVHRTFSQDEAVIACFVAAFALDSAPIGRLILVGADMRAFLAGPYRHTIRKAIANNEKVFLIYDQVNRYPYPIATLDPDYVNTLHTYISEGMTENNYKANLIYLNGAFARLKAEPIFANYR